MRELKIWIYIQYKKTMQNKENMNILQPNRKLLYSLIVKRRLPT